MKHQIEIMIEMLALSKSVLPVEELRLIFKPAHASYRPACAWFLKIDPVQMVSMHACVCVCVCVCVSAQGY